MTTTQNYLNNAVFSSLAYENLQAGMHGKGNPDYLEAIQRSGVSDDAAKTFADTYSIISTFTDPASGLSATVFQDAGGRKTLSIRGTEINSIQDWLADANLAVSSTTLQMNALQNFYDQLKSNGVISSSEQITVTGHSLGGYLAQVFTANNLDSVDHAYTYGAPGIGGAIAEGLKAVGLLPSAFESIPLLPITNVSGIDPIAEYGIKLGEIIKLPIAGHSIKRLSSSLGEMIDKGIELSPQYFPWQLLSDGMKQMIKIVNQLFTQAKPSVSPIILDLDGDGVETTNVKDGAYFDHDGNGFAEQTGWAASDDGLLVMDRNNDGIINDGRELFGSETILSDGSKASNGFEALAELDDNHDGKIDASDAAFVNLKVWKDIDGDGCRRQAIGNRQKAIGNNILELAA
jgi:pimeloyl-ACP methyl ester carboxylesterase